MPKTKRIFWGFDTDDLAKNIRPQDDFFNYTSDMWFRRNPIPESESRWGSFTMLRFQTDKQLQVLLKEIAQKKRVAPGSAEQMVRDFYRSGINLKERKRLGLSPIKTWMHMIEKIVSISQLLNCFAEFHRLGVGAAWGFGIDQDSKKSDRYILYLGQDGLGMPDRDYYLKDDRESKRIRSGYVTHMQAMFKLMGKSSKESGQAAKVIMNIETELAKASMAKEDIRDPEKTYHKMTVSQLARHTPELEWENYLKRIGATKSKEIILMQPDFFIVVQKMLKSVSLDDWKIYLTWHLISDFSGYLAPAFGAQTFKFYGTLLVGTKKMRPLWRRILGAVNANLDEPFGKLYIERYFSPQSKKKVNAIVNDLFTAYENRLKKLDWMSSETKHKALKKLKMMVRKIGYPSRWRSYKGLIIKSNDYAGNAVRVAEYEHRKEMRKLAKPVDRSEWFMSPQMVNAYCNYGMNEIVFPAAILQGAFFNVNADDAINYGAIGSVIGHEMTHGFDDQGAKFDAEGNMKSWWTATDKKHFEMKAKKVVDQFDKYRVADGVKVNGRLTLSENIADLGGISIAFDAYELQLARSGRKNIEGFTPEQRFFMGYAQTEREAERPEFTKMLVLTDAHAPSIFRVNGALSNLPEFHKAFGVKKGDALYREPSKQIKVW